MKNIGSNEGGLEEAKVAAKRYEEAMRNRRRLKRKRKA